jgi:hypothetical protein
VQQQADADGTMVARIASHASVFATKVGVSRLIGKVTLVTARAVKHGSDADHLEMAVADLRCKRWANRSSCS